MFKFVKNAAVAAMALAATASSFAASTLPTGVATGISDAASTGTEVIGLLAVAGSSVWLVSKVLRKFGLMM